jgi:hypothetical protein
VAVTNTKRRRKARGAGKGKGQAASSALGPHFHFKLLNKRKENIPNSRGVWPRGLRTCPHWHWQSKM